MKKTVSGNEAIAYGALSAGVKVVSGYPGTPSTEVIASLLKMDIPGTEVEWSTNEKVAFEVAAGAAWGGHRALCTMKMSGLNVCYDSLAGIAYSGCPGALVVYVADDPGVSAGMVEQDTRGFALMSDMPMFEPCSVQEIYDMTIEAFDVSAKIKGPVFIRLVTNNSQSHAEIDIKERTIPADSMPLPMRDTAKNTKAGAAICMQQHLDAIARLEKAGKLISEKKLNTIMLKEEGGIGLISIGIANGYVSEALQSLEEAGIDVSGISVLKLAATVPFADEEISQMIRNCKTLVILEELEPHLEKKIYMQAYKMGSSVKIIGKEDGTFRRIGEYNAQIVRTGILKALGIPMPEMFIKEDFRPEQYCPSRPIGFCAGCPHRGTYMGLIEGLKRKGYKKEDVYITGDIGCTILGISPPFNILSTELAMGASIPLAQGFAYSNIPTPIIATIGDSTFFHAGLPGLVNALQHNINMTVIILDNGWTSMTGMQVNPGTIQECQGSWKQLDIVQVVKGMGVEQLFVADPYHMDEVAGAVEKALGLPGVKVIISQRECAIEAARRKISYGSLSLDSGKCIKCRKCIVETGCPAVSFGESGIGIDYSQCNGCGLCAQVCPVNALSKNE